MGIRGDPGPYPRLRLTKDEKIFLDLRRFQLSPVSAVHHHSDILGLFANQLGTLKGSTNHGKDCVKTPIIYLFAFVITHA